MTDWLEHCVSAKMTLTTHKWRGKGWLMWEVHVYCREQTVLCAGTFGSPRILLLSGLGPKDTLERLNIPVQVDLLGLLPTSVPRSLSTLIDLRPNSKPKRNCSEFSNIGLCSHRWTFRMRSRFEYWEPICQRRATQHHQRFLHCF